MMINVADENIASGYYGTTCDCVRIPDVVIVSFVIFFFAFFMLNFDTYNVLINSHSRTQSVFHVSSIYLCTYVWKN